MLEVFITIKHFIYNIQRMFHVKQVYKLIEFLGGLKNILQYNYHVFFCTNQRIEGHPRGCCAEKNSLKLRNLMKVKTKALGLEKVRINTAGCLDSCEYGPTVVIYPEGTWYTIRDERDVDDIIDTHLQRGKIVRRLLIKEKN